MSKRHHSHKRRSTPDEQLPPGAPSNRSLHLLWIGAAAAVVVLVLLLAYLRPRSSARPIAAGYPEADAEASKVTAEKAAETAVTRIAGRWLRQDGDYTLELAEPAPDGKLTARYSNPAPINVGQAEWRREKQDLIVFVELRDANYPGSTYSLRYLPSDDRLQGTYFQAATRESYDVEFARQP